MFTNIIGSDPWRRLGDWLLTAIILYWLWLVLLPLIQWAVINASWQGTDRSVCHNDGACWIFVQVNINKFIYGFYPISEQWRINFSFTMLGVLLVLSAYSNAPYRRYWIALLIGIYPIVAFALLYGGIGGLKIIETHLWGGLMLTLVLAIVGIASSLPLGILLALGRRSQLPVIRFFSIFYIELLRGIPLITVLFMASVMLPMFFPPNFDLNKLLRAMIGIIMFQSAYIAEVVRGGIQAIPKGQYEAALSLGLSYWHAMLFIILPQALRHVIPGLVNTFIALFKDTTLVLIIGLFDLLGIVEQSFSDPLWLGYTTEGYLTAAAIFWFFCYSMSRYSQYLERTVQAGSR